MAHLFLYFKFATNTTFIYVIILLKLEVSMEKKKKNVKKIIEKIIEAKETAVLDLDQFELPEQFVSSAKVSLNDIKGRVKVDRLVVRDEPKESGYLQFLLHKGEIIYLEDCGSDKFFKLQNDNLYVMKKYIQILENEV